MKKIGYLLILIFCFCGCFHQSPQNYYVDALNGDDQNAGTSEKQAWKTIHRLNQHTFQAGERILLKAGSVFYGQMELKGSGTLQTPIIVDMYGDGNKPQINGQGKKDYTLLLENTSHWEINNLDITNTGSVRKAKRRGVVISANNYGESHHIHLKQLDVHDVNGSLVKEEGGGSAIFWVNGGDNIPSRFVDLRIEDCHLYNCGRNGITSSGNIDRNKWYPSLKVVIRGNLLEGIPGDGIVPIGCDGALIEYNTMRDCPNILSHAEAAAGIWPWSSDNTVIQFNEVSQHRAKWDGQGFDSDYNCHGTIIQYNYSHDNNGGFLLVCNDGASLGKAWNQGTTNSIIRYNISVNDGLRTYPTEREGWFSPCMHITGPVENTLIHHNIIVQLPKPDKKLDETCIKMDTWGGWPIETSIRENYFIAEAQPLFAWGKDTLTVFKDNQVLIHDNLVNKTLQDYFEMTLGKQNEDENLKPLRQFLETIHKMK